MHRNRGSNVINSICVEVVVNRLGKTRVFWQRMRFEKTSFGFMPIDISLVQPAELLVDRYSE
jgi:hypothetical protein